MCRRGVRRRKKAGSKIGPFHKRQKNVEDWKIERRKSGVCGEVLNRWHVCRDGMPKRAIKLTVGAVGRIRKTEAGKGGDRKEEDHLVRGSTRGSG